MDGQVEVKRQEGGNSLGGSTAADALAEGLAAATAAWNQGCGGSFVPEFKLSLGATRGTSGGVDWVTSLGVKFFAETTAEQEGGGVVFATCSPSATLVESQLTR